MSFGWNMLCDNCLKLYSKLKLRELKLHENEYFKSYAPYHAHNMKSIWAPTPQAYISPPRAYFHQHSARLHTENVFTDGTSHSRNLQPMSACVNTNRKIFASVWSRPPPYRETRGSHDVFSCEAGYNFILFMQPASGCVAIKHSVNVLWIKNSQLI